MTGKYHLILDAKGRLIVPSKLREELGDVFYVTIGLEGCLSVYTEVGWNAIVDKINALPRASAHRARYLFANCAKCEPDKQFRFLIPTELRQYASLQENVTMIGVGDYAEIWDADTYQANEAEQMTPEALRLWMDELNI